MKKHYSTPELDVTLFDAESIIVTSETKPVDIDDQPGEGGGGFDD